MLAANFGGESSWGSPDARCEVEEENSGFREHVELLEEEGHSGSAALREDVYAYGTLKRELTSEQRCAHDAFLSGQLLAFVLSGGGSVSDGRLGMCALPL